MTEYLQRWDGKHTDYLIKLYDNNVADPAFIDEIVRLYLERKDLQRATSWIIKHYVDNGGQLSKSQVEDILSVVESLKHWESQLHILQLIPKFEINKNAASLIEPFVRGKMNSEKKFVKASAYESYYEIVKVYPELKHEFQLLCEDALANESASIQSKVRKILARMKK